MPDSVVIMGCGQQDYLPDGFPEISSFDERWGVNNCWCEFDTLAKRLNSKKERLTRIIAMDDLRRDSEEWPKYVKAITEAGVPVVTCTAYPEYPTTVDYPLADVLDSVFGGHDAKHTSGSDDFSYTVLDNTINYAVALAMHEGAKKIGLWCCEFTKNYPHWIKERRFPDKPYWWTYYQEPAIYERRFTEPGGEALMFLLGIAYQRGIEIVVPHGSSLFNSDIPHFWYGYQEQPDI